MRHWKRDGLLQHKEGFKAEATNFYKAKDMMKMGVLCPVCGKKAITVTKEGYKHPITKRGQYTTYCKPT